jgi:hypothetical protein
MSYYYILVLIVLPTIANLREKIYFKHVYLVTMILCLPTNCKLGRFIQCQRGRIVRPKEIKKAKFGHQQSKNEPNPQK